MNTNTQLFVTDLDKTFLRTDLSVSSFSREVWNDLVAKDVLLTFATARSYEKSLSLLRGLNLKVPAVVLNGALIVASNGDILASNALDKGTTDSILAIGKQHNLSPFVLGLEGLRDTVLHTAPQNPGQAYFLEHRAGDPRLKLEAKARAIEMNLTITFIDTQTALTPLRDELINLLGPKIETKLAQDPYCSGYWNLEVLDAKGDKVHALKQLSERLNVSAKDVTVFGDNHNDIGMFKWAGRGVAVANAVEELKEISLIVLPDSNDTDAVAKFLAFEFKIKQ